MDINRHRLLLAGILKDIYSLPEPARCLGFKGGTALMFLYGLPRFSVDLDFNLLDPEREQDMYHAVRRVLLKYGSIADEAFKYYGPVLVLDYGKGERKLKVEISKRQFDNHYEIKNFFGTSLKVMTMPDMFSHKLCALLDRGAVINRDIFDAWFFMEKCSPLNKALIETRMNMPLAAYLDACIEKIKTLPEKTMLHGLGDLMDEKTKDFVRTRLKKETLGFLEFYRDFPLISGIDR
jgi:predicted nucleotidyltransferase component of viral defense system